MVSRQILVLVSKDIVGSSPAAEAEDSYKLIKPFCSLKVEQGADNAKNEERYLAERPLDTTSESFNICIIRGHELVC